MILQKKRLIPVLPAIAFVLLFTLAGIVSKGQSATANQVRTAIAAINNRYDSAFFLSFDVKMIYDIDTLWAGTDSADYNHTEMTGSYTFNGNKALYKLGEIEYLQNDSFSVALYKENKLMLVARPLPGQKPGMFIPTRSMLDSMMTRLEQQFVFEMVYSSDSSAMIIKLDANSADNIYRSIRIVYDPVSYLLTSVQYTFKDMTYAGDLPEGSPDRIATMSFNFSGYRVEAVSASVFDETKYIFFDGPNEIKPIAAYRDFTIYKNY
jgi:hypothetical protein